MRAKTLISFMRGIIDYAGMYPPANLNLTDAFRKYTEYLDSEDEWIMSRFVCSLKAFEDIFKQGSETLERVKRFEADRWLSFSILLNPGAGVKEFLSGFRKDLETIRKISEFYNGKVVADALEFKIPAEITGKFGNHAMKKMFKDANDIMHESGLLGVSVFAEPPVNDKFETIFRKLAEASSESNHKGAHIGFKLRTGGVTSASFPSIEQVSAALVACRENKIPFKATAGLHHPVRHLNDTVGTKMHGFFNVFGAGILHYANSLSDSELKHIIMTENESAFGFTDDIFSWNDITTDAATLEKARKEYVISFGSCSFNEPREDLRNLGFEF